MVVVEPGRTRCSGCCRTSSESIGPIPPKWIAGSPIPTTATAATIVTSLMIATHAIPVNPLV
jgi:hypothetical protein